MPKPNSKREQSLSRRVLLAATSGATLISVAGSPAAWAAGQATAVNNLPIAIVGRVKTPERAERKAQKKDQNAASGGASATAPAASGEKK